MLGVNFNVLTLTIVNLYNNLTAVGDSTVMDRGFTFELEGSICGGVDEFSFGGVSGFSATSLAAEVAGSVAVLRGTIVVSLHVLMEKPTLVVVSTIFTIQVGPNVSTVLLIVLPVVIIVITLVVGFNFPVFRGVRGGISGIGHIIRRGLVNVHIIGTFIHRSRRGSGFRSTSSRLTGRNTATSKLVMAIVPIVVLLFGTIVIFICCGNTLSTGTNAVRINRVSIFTSCVIRVLVGLVVVSVVLLVLTETGTYNSHIIRILSASVSVIGPGGTFIPRGPGNRIRFGGISFGCSARSRNSGILRGVDFGTGPKRVINVINNANYNGSDLIGLVPHLCSTANKRILISNIGIGSCSLATLHSVVNIILRGGILFDNAVRSGVQ